MPGRAEGERVTKGRGAQPRRPGVASPGRGGVPGVPKPAGPEPRRKPGLEAPLDPAPADGERAFARAVEEAVERRTRDLRAALDEQTARLQDVDHRAKNNLQVIASLVLLKARRLREPATRAVLQGMADRIAALAAAHRLLRPAGATSRFDLADLAADCAEDLAAGLDPGRVALAVEADPIALPADMAAPLALLLHELARNAVRHAFPDGRRGRLAITARRAGGTLTLTVADDGVGIDAASPDPEGYGRSLAEMLTRQMRGTLTVEDSGPGTRAVAVLPLDGPEAGRSS